jgi:hypothetical protein
LAERAGSAWWFVPSLMNIEIDSSGTNCKKFNKLVRSRNVLFQRASRDLYLIFRPKKLIQNVVENEQL